MREFILTLLGVSLVSGLASMLTPEGKGGGLRTCVGFACGLCALSITVGPVISFIGALSDGGKVLFDGFSEDLAVYDYEKIFDQTLAREGERVLEVELKAILCDEFQIEEKNIDIEATLCESEAGIEVERVILTLRGSAVLIDAHKISERVTTLLSCECRVLYGGKNDTKG